MYAATREFKLVSEFLFILNLPHFLFPDRAEIYS
jgi:hypothetical protein